MKDAEVYVLEYEGEETFDEIYDETRWENRQITVYGRQVNQPRLTANYGLDYRYSGTHFTGHDWSPVLASIKKRVEEQLGVEFNSALLNLYRDGQDSISWHSDDEKELGDEPIVVSISFGAPRKFCFRRKDGGDQYDVTLVNKSLVIMMGETQKKWQHCVPKTKNAGARINITFRRIV